MVLGLILAGGRSRRFGAEKAAAELGGASLLARAYERLRGVCDEVAVSAPAGGQAEELATRLGLIRLADPRGSPPGPLSGVLAGLQWAQGRDELLLTLPCDAPLLPDELAERLLAGIGAAPAAVTRSPRGLQPLCAVWRTMMIRPLLAALADGVHPPAQRVLTDANAAAVDFPDDAPFLNVNTPEDFAEAERRLAAGWSPPPVGR